MRNGDTASILASRNGHTKIVALLGVMMVKQGRKTFWETFLKTLKTTHTFSKSQMQKIKTLIAETPNAELDQLDS